MKIWKIRNILYRSARVLGDVEAVQTGKIAQRILRRIAGRLVGRVLGRLFR